MEAERQAEAVGECQPVVEDVAGVDRARRLGVGVFARDEVAAVGGDDQAEVLGPRLDAAVEDAAQRLVLALVGLELTSSA